MVLGSLLENRTRNAGDFLEVFSSYLHIGAFTFFFFCAWKRKVFFYPPPMSFFSLGVGTTDVQYRPLWLLLDMVSGSVTEEREDTSQ